MFVYLLDIAGRENKLHSADDEDHKREGLCGPLAGGVPAARRTRSTTILTELNLPSPAALLEYAKPVSRKDNNNQFGSSSPAQDSQRLASKRNRKNVSDRQLSCYVPRTCIFPPSCVDCSHRVRDKLQSTGD
ncbi:hypothetical protein OPT61_g6008 [Boeremia exigua]|uniref:Uncharacterized protein n=1 Tax=Boeremia exigua TaxID=749465 RepID=A0ACC2I877_9PLEO|nr:hypothetical protein OPT61_g6008 [Boeremia exigua]